MTQIAAFSSDKIGGGTEILTLDGRCELSTALHAEQQIVTALDAGATEIIVDLRGVTWLDRSLLQVLFRARIRMGQSARLVLVRPNAHVWELFEESGLDRGFASVRDLKGALAELAVAARPVRSATATPPRIGGVMGVALAIIALAVLLILIVVGLNMRRGTRAAEKQVAYSRAHVGQEQHEESLRRRAEARATPTEQAGVTSPTDE